MPSQYWCHVQSANLWPIDLVRMLCDDIITMNMINSKIFGNYSVYFLETPLVVVAILVTSRYICAIFSPNNDFAILLGCTVSTCTMQLCSTQNREEGEMVVSNSDSSHYYSTI